MAYKIEGIHFEQSANCIERKQDGICPFDSVAKNLRRVGQHESSEIVALAGRVICERSRLKIAQQTRDTVVTSCHVNTMTEQCGHLEFQVKKI